MAGVQAPAQPLISPSVGVLPGAAVIVFVSQHPVLCRPPYVVIDQHRRRGATVGHAAGVEASPHAVDGVIDKRRRAKVVYAAGDQARRAAVYGVADQRRRAAAHPPNGV